MNLNDYQRFAATTAIYPPQNGLIYTALGLAGEAGEVANKVKKVIRDGNGIVTPEQADLLIDELGDVLWYVAMLADELGVTLELVALHNVNKLANRVRRGVIGGSGDGR